MSIFGHEKTLKMHVAGINCGSFTVQIHIFNWSKWSSRCDSPLPPLPGYTSVPSDGYSWLHVYDRQTEQAMITSVAIASSADNEEQTNMHEIQLPYKKLKNKPCCSEAAIWDEEQKCNRNVWNHLGVTLIICQCKHNVLTVRKLY